jgi:hypothetical protein
MHGNSVSKSSRIEEGPVLIGNLRLHSRQTEFPQGVLVLFCFLFVFKLLTKFFRWMVPIILGQNGIRCRNGPECRGVCGSISELSCNNLIYILQVDVLTAAKGTGHILDILHSLPTLFQDRKRAELRTCLDMVLFFCDIFDVFFTFCA